MAIERVITEWHSRKNMSREEFLADFTRRYWDRDHEIIDERVTKSGRVSYLVRSTLNGK
jgi:hypothetical protein